MNPTSVELPGTLQADGTLILAEKPNLPPGPVRVRIEQLDPTLAPVMVVLERIWADQRARGHVARSREEIDAEISAMRQEDEERMQSIERLHEECQKYREGPPAKDKA